MLHIPETGSSSGLLTRVEVPTQDRKVDGVRHGDFCEVRHDVMHCVASCVIWTLVILLV